MTRLAIGFAEADNAKYKNARNIVDFNVYSFSIFICHFSF